MPIDFFKEECQTKTNATMFGLCDEEDFNEKTPAYVSFDIKNAENWNATVKNEGEKDIIFTAIDHCVIKTLPDIDSPKRCDCMLTYEDAIIFVELKNSKRSSTTQLDITIKLFSENYNFDEYNMKEAYLSNKKKQSSPHPDRIQEFLDNTGFTLYFSTEIEI